MDINQRVKKTSSTSMDKHAELLTENQRRVLDGHQNQTCIGFYQLSQDPKKQSSKDSVILNYLKNGR